jgi:hypothetical protein
MCAAGAVVPGPNPERARRTRPVAVRGGDGREGLA